MSSTFLGLNTAYTGLQAANAALNTTANNIANVDTPNYKRQDVTFEDELIRNLNKVEYRTMDAKVYNMRLSRIEPRV